jgi:hypothetical protein
MFMTRPVPGRRLIPEALFDPSQAPDNGPCYIPGMEDYAERLARLDPDGSKSYRLLLLVEGKTDAEIAAEMARMYPTSH